MVLAYFDSSLLLSFLFRENKAEDARDIWKRYANCKSLDAIHIATALDIRDSSDCEVHICSFDKNMINLAKQFGFIAIKK